MPQKLQKILISQDICNTCTNAPKSPRTLQIPSSFPYYTLSIQLQEFIGDVRMRYHDMASFESWSMTMHG